MNAGQGRCGRATANGRWGVAAVLLVIAGAAGLAALACGSSTPPLDPDCAPGSVIALGDSITYGAGLPHTESYPAQLSTLLGAKVCNVGDNGDTAKGGLRRLQRDVLQFDPRVVVILFGTNDSGLFASDGKAAVPVGDYTDEMQQIVARVRRAGAVPVLVTLPPMNVPLLTSEHLHPENRGAYDAVIRQTAAAEAAPLVDLDAAFGGDLSLLIDGIHPTAAGSAVIARAVNAVVAPIVAAPDAKVGASATP
jgi:lysophospholipase L1-like esterase